MYFWSHYIFQGKHPQGGGISSRWGCDFRWGYISCQGGRVSWGHGKYFFKIWPSLRRRCTIKGGDYKKGCPLEPFRVWLDALKVIFESRPEKLPIRLKNTQTWGMHPLLIFKGHCPWCCFWMVCWKLALLIPVTSTIEKSSGHDGEHPLLGEFLWDLLLGDNFLFFRPHHKFSLQTIKKIKFSIFLFTYKEMHEKA